eukprot:9448194-Karenia_brevis.AAC.1
MSCVLFTPLVSRMHHPPVVSVQGEAANPGPHDEHVSHDADDEANITMFFGNVGSMYPTKNRDKIHCIEADIK